VSADFKNGTKKADVSESVEIHARRPT